MGFGLRCPECRKTFRYDPLAGHPRFCPLCRVDIGSDEPDDNVIAIPAFLSAKTRATDQTYRDLERSSEVRVEQAAAMAGVSASDMSDLKITNIRDTRHEGDVAAVPVVNDVTRQMDFIKQQGGVAGFAGAQAVEYSGAVQAGPYPNQGAKMRSMIQRGNGLPERPGVETQQPGYRIRG